MYNRSSEQYYDQTQPPPPYSAHAPQQDSKQPPLPYPSDDSESFGPPRRQDSFGPPVTGGFQHGYEGGQFGAYEASNPQGHMGYFGTSESDARGFNSSSEQIPYGANRSYYQGEESGDAPVNPNAPEEERGLGGTVVGGAAGYYVGHKQKHGLLGAVGGAIVGNIVGDAMSGRHDRHGSRDRHDRSHERSRDRHDRSHERSRDRHERRQDRRDRRHDRHDRRHGCHDRDDSGRGGFGRGDGGSQGGGFGRSSWGGRR